jgi:exodeoxyribonuclease-5
MRGDYGGSRVIEEEDLEESDLRESQIIVGRNTTSKAYNEVVRTLLGFRGNLPCDGERLISLDNRSSFTNGELFRVCGTPVMRGDEMMLELVCEEDLAAVPFVCKTSREAFRSVSKNRRFPSFDFGYVLTCHKAQGSQWPSVLVIDESQVFGKNRDSWLYTAITRAQEKVTIVV